MVKLFYDHLLFVEEIIAVINSHKLSESERVKLLTLIDQTMHTHILDEVLTHLPTHYHQTFLAHFHSSPGDTKLLEFLKKEAREDIEEVIKSRAKKVKDELLAEIRKAKKK